jgi:hypothetical protein
MSPRKALMVVLWSVERVKSAFGHVRILGCCYFTPSCLRCSNSPGRHTKRPNGDMNRKGTNHVKQTQYKEAQVNSKSVKRCMGNGLVFSEADHCQKKGPNTNSRVFTAQHRVRQLYWAHELCLRICNSIRHLIRLLVELCSAFIAIYPISADSSTNSNKVQDSSNSFCSQFGQHEMHNGAS